MKMLLIVAALVALTATGGAYAATESTGEQNVLGPAGEPVTIGWVVDRTQVTGVSLTWSPLEEGVYTIEVMIGDSIGLITTPLAAADYRTDTIPLDEYVDTELVGTVEVSIFQH